MPTNRHNETCRSSSAPKRQARWRAAIAVLPVLWLLQVALHFEPGQLLTSASVAFLLLLGLVGLARTGPQFALVTLLILGYFVGWIKLRYNSWVGYALPDILCLFLLVHTFVGRRGALPLPRNGLTHAVLLLTLYCLLELFNPESPLLRTLAGLRSWLLYTWLMFVGYGMLRSRRQVQQIYVVLTLLSIVTALYGLYQWHQGPSALVGYNRVLDAQVTRMGWSDRNTGWVFRAFSTFVMPGAFGSNMAMGLLVAYVLIGTRQISAKIKCLAAAGSPLLLAGIAASGSRAAVVDLVLGLAIILLLRRGRAAVSVVLLLAAGAWLATSLTTKTIGARYDTLLDKEYVIGKWMEPLKLGIETACRFPLGKGLGYTAGLPQLLGDSRSFSHIETMNIDSGLGVAAAELGFAGLAIFVLLLTQLAICPLRSWKRAPDGALKDLLVIPVCFSLVFVLTSIVAPMSGSLPQSAYTWLLIGMVFRIPYLPPEEVASVSPTPPSESFSHETTPHTVYPNRPACSAGRQQGKPAIPVPRGASPE